MLIYTVSMSECVCVCVYFPFILPVTLFIFIEEPYKLLKNSVTRFAFVIILIIDKSQNTLAVREFSLINTSKTENRKKNKLAELSRL